MSHRHPIVDHQAVIRQATQDITQRGLQQRIRLLANARDQPSTIIIARKPLAALPEWPDALTRSVQSVTLSEDWH